MVTFSGSFTNEDLKGDTGRKDPVDEVIDILTAPTVGSGPPRGAPARAMRNVSATRPSVNVQQLDKVPLNLNDLYGDGKSLGLYTGGPRLQEQIDFDLYNALSPRPQDNLSGFQQASAPSLGNIYGDGRALGLYTPPQERGEGIAGPYEAMDPDMFDPDTGEYINFLDRIEKQRALNSGQGIAGINTQGGYLGDELFNIPTNRPIIPAGKASSMPPQNLIDQINPTGIGGILQGILGSVTGSSPAIYGQTDEYGQPLYDGDENFAVGRKFENPATAKRLGFLPVGKDAAGNIVYDVDPAIKASQARQEEDSRKDREDRERAALLAAQNQPVDPCPEGYRLDPVSKVCVPTDDTTEPTDPVKRTYDTMTKPEPNYTAATGFTVPSINLPDIFGG